MYLFGRGKVRVGRRYKQYLPVYHYGPAILCIMFFTPLLILPLAMAIINAAYVSFKEKNIHLLFPLLFLTLTFYVTYGWGEIYQSIKGKNE